MQFLTVTAALRWYLQAGQALHSAQGVTLAHLGERTSRPPRRPGLTSAMVAYLDVAAALAELTPEQRAAVRLGALEPEHREAWTPQLRRTWQGGQSKLGKALHRRGLVI